MMGIILLTISLLLCYKVLFFFKFKHLMVWIFILSQNISLPYPLIKLDFYKSIDVSVDEDIKKI